MLVEDHEWARVGLSLSIESKSAYKIVVEAENGKLAIEYAREYRPDIIMMDIEMPVMDGLTATKAIKEEFPDMKVVMLTSHKDAQNISAALACGANAYCMKDIRIERLIQVLEMVADGATWFDPGINEMLMRILLGKVPTAEKIEFERESSREIADLTERELDVLELIVGGKSNKEIADALNITVHTVKIHVGNIIQKMGVEDRTQVAIKALQNRLIKGT
jgi:DNA-binding NarL/FixJ family response regulator